MATHWSVWSPKHKRLTDTLADVTTKLGDTQVDVHF